ncbi:MAG TPA: MBL fold metallo-hydrolase [Burkholderiaceae bacterium]|nr:MBL fold metallo-hydrolase [Burkholderiaceae bacterium]
MPRQDYRVHEFKPPVTPRPAATILLLRDTERGLEVLMTRRSMQASFAPGAFVFPGGALDAADQTDDARKLSRAREAQSHEQQAFTVAAIREAFEELGVLLAREADGTPAGQGHLDRLSRDRDADFLAQMTEHGLSLAVEDVWWLCHWITDPDLPKRFDARFFVARMPEDQEPVADEGETFEPVWISPKDALKRHEEGSFSMIFPTIRTLRRLAEFSHSQAVLDACTDEKPMWVSSPRGGKLRGAIERFSEHEPPYGELELIVPDGRVLHELDWQHEKPVALLRNVQRLTAPNPGRMTGPGTNTYIVGEPGAGYMVIDPGPDLSIHVKRIAEIVGGELKAILCTHAHPDHSPGAAELKALTGAPILGAPSGPHFRSEWQFTPDRTLQDGDVISVPGSTLRVLHTPGHASNHLCFLLEEDGLLFSGDHINNGSTVVIDPPDGNMRDYLIALERLLKLPFDYILPAHGWVLGFAHDAIRQLIAHRLKREAKVMAAVRSTGGGTMDELVKVVYDDVDKIMHPVAKRSLYAHLDKLAQDGMITGSVEGRWAAVA